jgi:hypothetical protein
MTLDAANNWYFYKSDFVIPIGDASGNTFVGIGDTRVYFQMIDPSKLSEITIMAKQENGTLAVFRSKETGYAELLYDGILSKEEVLKTKEKDNTGGTIVEICLTLLFAACTAVNIRRIWNIYKLKN